MNKNLYGESMRRFMRIGIALLIACVALTAILCAGNASENEWSKSLDGPFRLMPVLPYFAFVGGIAFAYTGFAFLNKRCDSDFFHSLPVRRSDLFIATTLAALTWTAATVIASVLATAVVYLFMNVPFVAQYLLLGVPFFIVATMLVFAGAAIACSITGTFFANLILTGLVLLLPRFLLFWAGRTVVANTWIIGWRDLTGMLNPNTNIVTGMLVMLSRNMLKIDLVSMGNILYSLVLTCVELALGLYLFSKRPSEMAEQNAPSSKMQTLFACLLSLPVMLLFMRSPRKLTAAILTVASLMVFLVYQFAVLRKPKKVFYTLPWYLLTAAVVTGMYFGMAGVSRAMLNETPSAEQIQSVTFAGDELNSATRKYASVRISDIVFEEDSVKKIVSESLSAAVARINQPGYQGERYFKDGAFNTVEPIVITLKSGRKLHRSIEFSDMNELNDARSANAEYVAAVRTFPTPDEIDFLVASYSNDKKMSDEDAEKLRASFVDEYKQHDRIVNSYYDKYPLRQSSYDQTYNMFATDDEQDIGYFSSIGHVGARRFSDWHTVNLKTPKTAGLYMMLSNAVVEPDTVYNAATTLKILRSKLPDGGYISIGCTFTNVPMQNGTRQQINLYHDGNVYDGAYRSDNRYGASPEVMAQMMEILSRGMVTSDPNAMFAELYFSSNIRFDGGVQEDFGQMNSAYLAFTKEDEKALLKLISEWTKARYEQERIYNPELEATDVAMD